MDQAAEIETFENRTNASLWTFARLFFAIFTIPTLLYMALFVQPSILNRYEPKLTLVDVFVILFWLVGLGVAYKAARSPIILVRVADGSVEVRLEFTHFTRTKKIPVSEISVSPIRQIGGPTGNTNFVFSVNSVDGSSYDLCPHSDRHLVEEKRNQFCAAIAQKPLIS